MVKSLKRRSLDEALLNTSKGSGLCGTDGPAKSAAMTSWALDAAGGLALEARPSLCGLTASPPSCAETVTLSAGALVAAPEPDGVDAA
ncbi:hypothetical protein FLG15_05740 [Xanthomonas phaseoli pv. dieffenbachiae]